jgi:hypothetical protein
MVIEQNAIETCKLELNKAKEPTFITSLDIKGAYGGKLYLMQFELPKYKLLHLTLEEKNIKESVLTTKEWISKIKKLKSINDLAFNSLIDYIDISAQLSRKEDNTTLKKNKI